MKFIATLDKVLLDSKYPPPSHVFDFKQLH